MCGISGIVEYQQNRQVDADVLHRMQDVIRHRGPDDEGYFIADNVGLGMRRLSIIDLENGRQPISNEDGTVVVVCNGEIYNYRELTQQLRSRGHSFKTGSDVEVIVHLYEELGVECVHQLRGMFAFAIWDCHRQRLFVARDRLGVKPMYYVDTAAQLVFGSEIKSLLQHPEIDASPNLSAISAYLSLKYVPAPQTMFTGILSLPPAHCFTWDRRRGVQLREYWTLPFQLDSEIGKSEQDYADQLDQILHEAVRLHLRSDVPFGAFLSGGVDSSLIVALMSRLMNEPVKTFSVGFQHEKGQRDELPYARQVSRQFQTDHHEIIMKPDYFESLAEKVIWHLDQPIADQATLATFALSDLASQHVKMVLTGEGGDELFAGYARYYGERLSPLFRLFPNAINSMTRAMGSRLPNLRRQKIALFALSQKDEVRRFANWFPLFNSQMHAELIESDDSQINDAAALRAFGCQLDRTDAVHPLNRMLYVDTKLWLPDFLLLRGDKLTMAHSLEARVPLLDHKLVEFAATLPPKLKLKGSLHKYLLKKIARRYLPPSIVDRKKEGFPIPISSWFRHEMKPFVHDLLSPESIQRRGLFNAAYVNRLVEQHESGYADHGALIWGLISLELWFQIYIDSSARNSVRPTLTVTASL